MPKIRIDQYIFNHFNYGTIEDIQKLIMAGKVLNNNQPVYKPSEIINTNKANVRFRNMKNYVSRGGIKLKHALDVFNIELKDRVFLDIGSSTGGFTDCALQHGAKLVYAVDVGTNQLDYKLRTDSRVIVMEQMNFKDTTLAQFNPVPDCVSIDVSFTSIIPIIRHIHSLFKQSHEVICLIKPQFESYLEEIEEHGIVSSKTTHINVIHRVIEECIHLNYSISNISQSPIKGTKGNTEYLLHIVKKPHSSENVDDTKIYNVVHH